MQLVIQFKMSLISDSAGVSLSHTFQTVFACDNRHASGRLQRCVIRII